MAQKRFQSSMFGFNKGTVNTYIENLTKDYEEKLTSKDLEIEKLISQLKKVNKKYEEIKLEEERILTEKEKISQALVSANEKADKIVEDAKERITAEVVELEATAENEREKIVDIKRELKEMKAEASGILEKYEKAINEIVINNSVETPKIEEKKPKESIQVDGSDNETSNLGLGTPVAEDEESDDFFG
ncbi:MAG: DivIVA domain-containing protein [Clostridiales bacterium]|nr:DivIVA domain-containing protein [Clostridiales bacterium]